MANKDPAEKLAEPGLEEVVRNIKENTDKVSEGMEKLADQTIISGEHIQTEETED